METGILGRKIGMTRFFKENGESVPVTVVEAGPCLVVQKKTTQRDGYQALQLGFGAKAIKKGKKRSWPSKPDQGHFKKANVEPLETLREFRVEDVDKFEVGQALTIAGVKAGERIDVLGRSKGKGFQGVMKRHGFSGGRATHGCTTHRGPGSIGQSADPSRVLPGVKMPGQMGDARVTVRNLEIVDVDVENNILLIRGALPGAKRGILELRPTNKLGS